MRTRTPSIRHTLAITALLAVAAAPADARQDTQPHGAFCALAGLDLLAALDGTWTINQGPGTAHAGMMTLQLPAPPPAQVRFAFDAGERMIDVQGVDQADGMIMFATAPVQQAAADFLIGGPPEGDPTAPVCAWLETPTIIGTNQYVAWSREHWIFLQPGPGSTCDQIEERMGQPAPVYEDEATARIAERNRVNNEVYYREFCTDRLRELPDGGTMEMEMTLVLRFTSQNAGSGMVYFWGRTDKARFAASAPVTITR